MNKQEISIAVVLFAILVGWWFFTQRQAADRQQALAVKMAAEEAARPAMNATNQTPSLAAAGGGSNTASVVQSPVSTQAVVAAVAPAPMVVEPTLDTPTALPEITNILENPELQLMVTSKGGAIRQAVIRKYPETVEADSGPVVLDFSGRPALALEGIAGLTATADFAVVPGDGGTSAVVTATSRDGLAFERTIALGDDYVVYVTDRWVNDTDLPLGLASNAVASGPMHGVQTTAKTRGPSPLGIESLAAGEDMRPISWSKKVLPGLFSVNGGGGGGGGSRFGCSRSGPRGPFKDAVKHVDPVVQRWVGVKNRFFIQFITPQEPATALELRAWRDMEQPPNQFRIGSVAATLRFAPAVVPPGESFERSYTYYVGPTKFAKIRKLEDGQDKVMFRAFTGFGWWRAACIGLLWLLNAINVVVHNYGVAVILLTMLVRVAFWPVTHKSTESMKKMQEIQPLLKAVQKEHKENPQKLQRETARIYKENKVNPLASCLPMLVQIPVFIALFTVLRSAVELRYAPFLWIVDLSEPENLLAGVLPLIPALNILPVLMAVTMALQQHLTPATGDPQQKKMMMLFMPGMMLFMFYNMASGLVLYWTTSQILAIGQLMVQQRKTKAKAAKAVEENPGEIRETRQTRRRKLKTGDAEA